MSRSSKQAIAGLTAIAFVLFLIVGDSVLSNRNRGLRATVLSARAAVPGETVTITVSVRDTDGGPQRVDVDFGDGTENASVRPRTCHEGPSARSFDFEHAYVEKADYTVKATVTSGGCGAREERVSTLRGISVKPLKTAG